MNKFKYNIKSIVISIIIFEIIFFGLFYAFYNSFLDNNEMFRFEHKGWNYLWIILPIIIILFIFNLVWKNRTVNNFASTELIKHLKQPVSNTKTFFKYFFLRNAMAFLIIALLNPQFGKGTQKASQNGIEIFIALDISNSMRALDLDTNRDRLKIAQMSIERLLGKLSGDKIGLILFAGDAFVQLPLTSDYGSAKLFLNSISPDMISNQGTDINNAIEIALSSFNFNNGFNKSIIVISDGEDHEGKAIEIAKKAYKDGVIVNTIGMGTTKGTVIPNYKNGKRVGLKKDKEGNTVISKINTSLLKNIAKNGGGSYIQAKGNILNLTPLLEGIRKIEKSDLGSETFTDYEDHFQWFIGIGLIFIILHFLYNEDKKEK